MTKNNPLLSPADDTASRALIDTQTAITKVKEIVTECVSNGVNEGETTARLNKAIASECKRIDNVDLREQMRKALVSAARKWHYQLKQTYRILDSNFQQQSKARGVDFSELLSLTPAQKNIEFRKIHDDGTSPGIPIIEDYERSVRLAIKAMSAEPPKVVARANGKTYVMPLRNRAEMAVRYAANVKNLQELISQGVLWAWTSSHPNCSPRCKDFQGRLWSLFKGEVTVDGKKYGETGSIDGIHYDPIDVALKGKPEYGDGNGIISGYNCRHRLIACAHGSKPSTDYSEAEINKEYAIDKQQRSYENRIRQMKTEERQLRAAGMTKEAAALRKRWRRLTADYEIFSIEHKRAFYRYRCVIDRAEEVPVSSQPIGANIVENSKNSSTGVDTSVNWSIINNKKYFDQFKTITEKRNTAKSLSRAVMTTLRHRDHTKREDLYLIDLRSGGVAAKNLESKEDLKVGKTAKMEKLLSTEDEKQYILFHNHPLSSPPSVADLNSLYKNPKIKFGVIVGHDGTIYKYTAPKKEIYSSSLLELSISRYLLQGYSQQTATEKAYEDISIKFEFSLEVIKK